MAMASMTSCSRTGLKPLRYISPIIPWCSEIQPTSSTAPISRIASSPARGTRLAWYPRDADHPRQAARQRRRNRGSQLGSCRLIRKRRERRVRTSSGCVLWIGDRLPLIRSIVVGVGGIGLAEAPSFMVREGPNEAMEKSTILNILGRAAPKIRILVRNRAEVRRMEW